MSNLINLQQNYTKNCWCTKNKQTRWNFLFAFTKKWWKNVEYKSLEIFSPTKLNYGKFSFSTHI